MKSFLFYLKFLPLHSASFKKEVANKWWSETTEAAREINLYRWRVCKAKHAKQSMQSKECISISCMFNVV